MGTPHNPFDQGSWETLLNLLQTPVTRGGDNSPRYTTNTTHKSIIANTTPTQNLSIFHLLWNMCYRDLGVSKCNERCWKDMLICSQIIWVLNPALIVSSQNLASSFASVSSSVLSWLLYTMIFLFRSLLPLTQIFYLQELFSEEPGRCTRISIIPLFVMMKNWKPPYCPSLGNS